MLKLDTAMESYLVQNWDDAIKAFKKCDKLEDIESVAFITVLNLKLTCHVFSTQTNFLFFKCLFNEFPK